MACTGHFIYMSAFFLLAWPQKTTASSICLGLGLHPVGSVIFALHGAGQPPAMAGLGLVWIWGECLPGISSGAGQRREDFRYAAGARQWADTSSSGASGRSSSAGLGFVLPGHLALCWSSAGRSRPCALDGLAFWSGLTGFLFETIGDRQLAAFIKDSGHRGRIMTGGLWAAPPPQLFRRSRPVVGHGIRALSAPTGLAGLTGPLVITFFCFCFRRAALGKEYRGAPTGRVQEAHPHLLSLVPRRSK